ncbi:MAG: hypothetical protein WB989_09035, partial [Mycobacterium sp.]
APNPDNSHVFADGSHVAVVAASGLNPVRLDGGDISSRNGPTPIASKTETHSLPDNYVTVTFVVISPSPLALSLSMFHHHG